MQQEQSNAQRRLPGVSVLLKCLTILTVATSAVAGVIAVTSDRAIHDVADEGLLELSANITENLAHGISGAVRFQRPDNIESALRDLSEREVGRVVGSIVISLDGTALAQGGALAPADAAQLKRLAEVSLATGAAEVTSSGFWRGQPIHAGETVVGAVAVAWSPKEMLAMLEVQRREQLLMAGGIFFVLTLAAGLFFQRSLARPLKVLAGRTTGMANGDLASGIPYRKRKDEIGQIAIQLEQFRESLQIAEVASNDARFQSAGFQGASVPLVMTNTEFHITHRNRAFSDLIAKNASFAQLLSKGEREESEQVLDPSRFIQGFRADKTHSDGPTHADVHLGGDTFELTLHEIRDMSGKVSGYMMEWDEVTKSGVKEAILTALEAAQIRLDFDASGVLKGHNEMAGRAANERFLEAGKDSVSDLLETAPGQPFQFKGNDKTSTFDTFLFAGTCHVSGNFSPVPGLDGKVMGYVFLGHDITEAELSKTAAETRREEIERDQTTVVEALRTDLDALASGDLTKRLIDPFPSAHEGLRTHFNQSVSALESAVGTVRGNSSSILREADNISSAADDLSRRTEQQAATLEEFAASLTELTASVAATAEGAGQASDVVTTARDNAETSGGVVKEAVEAMGEISGSSDKISRIISVIDDIAFQTNLLALNAGVEAARAGDAGRGFAVVASEVRALAQRSSDAAREINELISSSGAQVKRGVSLVGRAGEALDDIVGSIGGIAEHVAAIAASAREQSTGIEEINVAMSQLDQATQQNVAMFEETTAATHALRTEASALVSASERFKVHLDEQSSKDEAAAPQSSSVIFPGNPPSSQPQTNAPETAGALALSVEEDENDWEDF